MTYLDYMNKRYPGLAESNPRLFDAVAGCVAASDTLPEYVERPERKQLITDKTLTSQTRVLERVREVRASEVSHG